MKEAMQALLRQIKKDPKLELPETRSALSFFANEFEQTARKLKWGSSDDPDKYCYNVVGAQIGAWLFEKLMSEREPPNFYFPIGTPAQRVPTSVQFKMSPMDITWEGNGYKMTFRQSSQDFSGFYPLQIFPFYEEESGTWGIAWADLLDKPYKVTLEGDEDAPGHILSLNLREAASKGNYRAFYLPLKPGQKYAYDVSPETELGYIQDEQTGTRIEPAAIAEPSTSTPSSSGETTPSQPESTQPVWPSPKQTPPPNIRSSHARACLARTRLKPRLQPRTNRARPATRPAGQSAMRS